MKHFDYLDTFSKITDILGTDEVRGGPGSLDTPEQFLSDKPLLFILPFLFPAEYSSKPHQVSSRQVLDDAAAYCTG